MIQLRQNGPGWLQPETGMGYQIATVVLKGGTRLNQVVIIEGMITRVGGLKDVPFSEEDIAEIVLTHEKWEWDRE